MNRLCLLDYGRFIAALSVLLLHYTFGGITNGKVITIEYIPWIIDVAKYGYLGVEFFFMISGYVIFFSAKNRSASQFIVSRAIRLYPSFWFAVIFTSFFAYFWGTGDMRVYPSQIIVNFTMMPRLFGHGFVDGVYWTLVYELTFYLGVFALILFGAQKKLETCFLVWPLIFVVASLTNLSELPYLGGYFYYFSAGSLFAVLSKNKTVYTYGAILITLFFCIYFSASKAPHLSESNGIEYSYFTIALLVSMLFVFFAFLTTKVGASIKLPKAAILGALTYPVYLIHAHFGYMFLNQYATDENKYFVYFTLLTIVILVSYAMHYFIEVKLAKFWKYLFNLTLGKLANKLENFLALVREKYSLIFRT